MRSGFLTAGMIAVLPSASYNSSIRFQTIYLDWLFLLLHPAPFDRLDFLKFHLPRDRSEGSIIVAKDLFFILQNLPPPWQVPRTIKDPNSENNLPIKSMRPWF